MIIELKEKVLSILYDNVLEESIWVYIWKGVKDWTWGLECMNTFTNILRTVVCLEIRLSATNGGGNTRCSLPLIVSTARMIALCSSLFFLLWKHNVIQNHFDVNAFKKYPCNANILCLVSKNKKLALFHWNLFLHRYFYILLFKDGILLSSSVWCCQTENI